MKKLNVYSDKDYVEIQNIIYGEEDVYIGDYFEKKREEINEINRVHNTRQLSGIFFRVLPAQEPLSAHPDLAGRFLP